MSRFKKDYKIIVCGDSYTGKTNFINKLTKNTFNDTYTKTIVSEFELSKFFKDDKTYRIQLWDLAGQDKDYTVLKIFSKDADGCIIMSDATNIETREK